MTSIPFSPYDKVFAYLRDSGHEDQELSVEQQERSIREWCQENSLILTHVFKDERRKGSSIIGRDQLQTMMHAFRHECEEKGVIVWKYNRFARSVDNAQFYRGEIRSRGYIFYSMNDKIPDGPMGRLFEAAIDFKDEQYLIDLSIDVKRGLYDLVENYGCVPGGCPTGFKREPVTIGHHRDGTPRVAHKWVPNPELAPLIRRAFEMRANSISLANIQKETHLLGGLNSYRTFFSNPIYTGILQYGDLRKENYCEPIVPREIWDRVQVVQNNYSHRRHAKSTGVDHPRRASSRFLLSGLAHCARCGSPLFGRSSPQKNGETYDSYICTRAYRKRDCTKARIPRKKLEEMVTSCFKDILLKPENLAAGYEELQKSQTAEVKEQENRKKAINSELGKVRRQIRNVTDSIAEVGGSKSLHDRLKDLELQEIGLLGHLHSLEQKKEQPIPTIPIEVLEALASNAARVFEEADLDTQRTLIRGLIERVDVMREEKELIGMIHYWYPPPEIETPRRPFDKGPGENVSIFQQASGPPEYRHILKYPFKATVRGYKKRTG